MEDLLKLVNEMKRIQAEVGSISSRVNQLKIDYQITLNTLEAKLKEMQNVLPEVRTETL